MKYVCLIYHEETKLATMSNEEFDALRGSYVAFTQSIIDGEQLVAGEALQPTHSATTVRMRHGELTTTDGPCVETREQVGGFFLIEARDLNEAIQIAARIPDANEECSDKRELDKAGVACKTQTPPSHVSDGGV